MPNTKWTLLGGAGLLLSHFGIFCLLGLFSLVCFIERKWEGETRKLGGQGWGGIWEELLEETPDQIYCVKKLKENVYIAHFN